MLCRLVMGFDVRITLRQQPTYEYTATKVGVKTQFQLFFPIKRSIGVSLFDQYNVLQHERLTLTH